MGPLREPQDRAPHHKRDNYFRATSDQGLYLKEDKSYSVQAVFSDLLLSSCFKVQTKTN